MPEPVSIVAAALSIVSSAYTLCKTSLDLVSGVKNAPRHISQVSKDLQNFYPVLRALMAAFEGIKPDSDGLIEDTCAAVHRSVQNCIHIFRDLTLMVDKYRSIEPANDKTNVRYEDGYGKTVVGKWSAIKWDFQKKDIDALTLSLAQCKETCQLAVSTAHFIINQSDNKRVYKSLQKNNEKLAKNYDLLKKLLRLVVQNDSSIRRGSIVASGQHESIKASKSRGDNESERLSQFINDIDSVLSYSPASTPRVSVVSRELPLDDDFRSLRASLYELQEDTFHISTPGNQAYEPSVRPISTGPLNESSVVGVSDEVQSDDPSLELAFNEHQFKDCSLTEFQDKVNLGLQTAFSAPEEIQHLRQYANRHPEIARTLIETYYQSELDNGIAIGGGWTSVFLAIALGKLELAKELRKDGAVIDMLFLSIVISAFQLATLCQDYDTCIWLLEEKVEFDNKYDADRTPFQNAIIREDVKMIEILLYAGANVLARDKQGQSDQKLGKTHTKSLILGTLLSSPPLARENWDFDRHILYSTLLHRAVWYWDLSWIRWLLERGFDPNARDPKGRTTLHLAAMGSGFHELEVVKLLVANGADPDCKDLSHGNTSLHIAALCDFEEAYRLLQDEPGGNVDSMNSDGFSPAKIFSTAVPLPYQQLYSRYDRYQRRGFLP